MPHIWGLDILITLNKNSRCLQGLIWNQLGNVDYNLYFLDWNSQTSNKLKGFLPYTTLYLTMEYFYGGLIQNYYSVEDL